MPFALRQPLLTLCAALALSGCVQLAPPPPSPLPQAEISQRARQAVSNFDEVVRRVEPVAEQVCREETPDQTCDFAIYIDRAPESGVNAFHTIDPQGRPAIVFTLGLIAVAQNTDELAFIMGHEAAHHIARHLPTGREQAEEGARVFADMARAQGATEIEIGEAAQIGFFVASREFGQRAELEADAIGTVIAARAGYDPIVGAAFFSRIPDPAREFLSTHPPNAARIEVVRSTLRAMGRPVP